MEPHKDQVISLIKDNEFHKDEIRILRKRVEECEFNMQSVQRQADGFQEFATKIGDFETGIK
jgi:hypothetical protein